PGRLHPVAARHPQVHEDDVRPVLRHELERLLTVGRLAHHLDVVDQPQHDGEPLPYRRLVVGHDDRDAHPGILTSTTHPSRAGPASTVPPATSARSRSPVSP